MLLARAPTIDLFHKLRSVHPFLGLEEQLYEHNLLCLLSAPKYGISKLEK